MIAWMAVLFGVLVGAGIVVAWLGGRASGTRWGIRLGDPTPAGEGAYRRGTTRDHLPRPAPFVVRAAAGLAVTWGVLTLVMFVPAGGLFTTLLLEEGHTQRTLAGVAVALVVLDGLVLGPALLLLARALLRPSLASARFARTIAIYSSVHHVAVFVACCCADVALEKSLGGLVLFAAIPCSLGLGHAALLGRASRRLRAVPVSDEPAAPVAP